jgi:hypothetical protein
MVALRREKKKKKMGRGQGGKRKGNVDTEIVLNVQKGDFTHSKNNKHCHIHTHGLLKQVM